MTTEALNIGKTGTFKFPHSGEIYKGVITNFADEIYSITSVKLGSKVTAHGGELLSIQDFRNPETYKENIGKIGTFHIPIRFGSSIIGEIRKTKITGIEHQNIYTVNDECPGICANFLVDVEDESEQHKPELKIDPRENIGKIGTFNYKMTPSSKPDIVEAEIRGTNAFQGGEYITIRVTDDKQFLIPFDQLVSVRDKEIEPAHVEPAELEPVLIPIGKLERVVSKELLEQLCKAAAVQEIPNGKVKTTVKVDDDDFVISGTMSSGAEGWICCWGHKIVPIDNYHTFNVPALSYHDHGIAVNNGTAERGYEGVIITHKGKEYVMAGKQITFRAQSKMTAPAALQSNNAVEAITPPKPKPYPGNKAIQGVLQKIVNEIPRCDVFRELMAGSAAVSSALAVPDENVHLNEKSEKVFQDLRFKYPLRIVTNDCAISIITFLPDKPKREEMIFLDPPYRLHTRPHSQKLYEHEMSDDDHVQLLSAVLDKGDNYKFMIIHPDDEMYNTMLASWRKVPIKVRYRNKTSNEVLYMNYPAPEVLQDYKFLGDGCHDRQRIKRKGDRWIAKLKGLPIVEQNYILDRLASMR